MTLDNLPTVVLKIWNQNGKNYLFISKYIIQEINLRVRFSNFVAIDNCENVKKKSLKTLLISSNKFTLI